MGETGATGAQGPAGSQGPQGIPGTSNGSGGLISWNECAYGNLNSGLDYGLITVSYSLNV